MLNDNEEKPHLRQPLQFQKLKKWDWYVFCQLKFKLNEYGIKNNLINCHHPNRRIRRRMVNSRETCSHPATKWNIVIFRNDGDKWRAHKLELYGLLLSARYEACGNDQEKAYSRSAIDTVVLSKGGSDETCEHTHSITHRDSCWCQGKMVKRSTYALKWRVCLRYQVKKAKDTHALRPRHIVEVVSNGWRQAVRALTNWTSKRNRRHQQGKW